jgi:hypothetical protein
LGVGVGALVRVGAVGWVVVGLEGVGWDKAEREAAQEHCT